MEVEQPAAPPMIPHYDWKRYWCPREGEFSLDSEGYLHDPETLLGSAHNSALKALTDIEDAACLILLGESGMGKTEAMKAERVALEAELVARGNVVTWVDLLAIGSAEQLDREVLHPLRTAQIEAGHHYLFLDGLDESLLRLSSIKKMMVAALNAAPAGHVRLRIACRTAEWPNSLEKDLRKVFGEEQVAVYELMPLRKKDVAAAIKARALDPDDVLSKLDAAGAVPFAIKPITLSFLLNRLTNGGGIPSSRTELYEEGCRQLVDESEHRQESGLAGSLTSEQRLALARRIAALTILTNRRQIFFGKDEGDATDADILSRDMADGESERAKHLDVPATPEAVQETLMRTALFSSRGPKRLGWSHQSYAEYLAATYLKAHELSWAQVRSLFLDPGDANVFPQLRGVAAWFAALNREAFEALVAIDPLILLTSDAVTFDTDDRQMMTGELLRLASIGAMGRIDPLHARVLQHLAYDGLAAQLRPVIEDRSRPEFERQLALEIAFHARVTDLAPTLIAVALDDNESLLIRTRAACFASRVGANANGLTALKSLLQVDRAIDTSDQLRGCALEALWPSGMLTLDELLAALVPPQRTNTHGTYLGFLQSPRFASLDRRGLVMALEWLLAQETTGQLPNGFEVLGDELVRRAWAETDDTEVRRLLADIALKRFRRFHSLVDRDEAKEFAKVIAREHDRRRTLASEVLLRATPDDKNKLLYGDTVLFNPAVDVAWFAAKVDAETDPDRRAVLEEMFGVFTMRMNEAIVEQMGTLRDHSPFVADKFRWLFHGMTLGSPEAEESKARFAVHEQLMAEIPKPAQLPKRISEILEDTLLECEAGQHDAFIALQYQMHLTTSAYTFETFEGNLQDTPGWMDAPPDRRQRIIEGAVKFVQHADPDTASWIGTDKYSEAALAGLRAFALIALAAPARVAEIDTAVWKRWAAGLLAAPLNDFVHELRPQLLRIAYKYAPEELREAIRPIVSKENDRGYVSVLREFRATWDEELTAASLDLVRSESLQATSLASIFDFLLEVDLGRSTPVLAELLDAALTRGDKTAVVALGVCAFVHATQAMWPQVWAIVSTDPELADEILKGGANGAEFGTKTIAGLTEPQLADLYLLMSRRFPPADDPEPASGFVAPHVQARWFRDSVLRILTARATQAACGELRRLIAELPAQQRYLVELLRDTDARRRAGMWSPATPQQLLDLTRKNDARFVETEDDLLDAVQESLRRFEKKLHAEETAVLDLWNETKQGHRKVYTPKDEDRFASLVARHLNDDLHGRGIIVNREVEVRKGERTDIYVDAIAKNATRITVVVEAKGCWNPQLREAIKDQLAERYLFNARTTRGLYLVGWFYCDHWADTDKARKALCPPDGAALIAELDQQATALSVSPRRIEAVVIDARLRFPVSQPAKAKKSPATPKSRSDRPEMTQKVKTPKRKATTK
jgi:hypothetical protein